MELLENGFCEVDGVDPSSLKNKGSPQKDAATVSTKIGIGSKPASSQKKTRGGKEDALKCQFCNKSDKTFTVNENLDMHFWKDCVMLTECKHCSQVIEIETYNQHLLKECDKASDFKQCARCKESVNKSEYEDHVASK